MKIGNLDIEKMYLGSDADVKVYLGDVKVYPSEEPTPPHDYSQDYLTFVAGADNMSVGLTNAGDNVYQYSVDSGQTWSNLANSGSTTSVNSGQTIIFKASGLTPASYTGIGTLKPTVSASVQGNIMSLVYGNNFSGQTTITNQNQFRQLFYNCTNITSAENLILPATTLADWCYYAMFQGCTNLTTAPSILPATTLAGYCYRMMFYRCTSLTTAPELPATTLTDYCYRDMFHGCASLTTAPVLPATTLASSCYYTMFQSCTSLNYVKCLATDISATDCTRDWVYNVAATGTFVKAASMSSWTTGTSGIPDGWTIENI